MRHQSLLQILIKRSAFFIFPKGSAKARGAEMRRRLHVEQQMSAPKELTDRRMKATTASPTAVQVE